MRVGAWLIGHAHGVGADIAAGSAVSPVAAATGLEARAATSAAEQAVDAPDVAGSDATGPAEPADPAEATGLADPAGLAEPAGLPELHAALRLVSSGRANSVTLCGFGSGQEVLRIARDLAEPGMVVEPLDRPGGGGIDVRVRRAVA